MSATGTPGEALARVERGLRLVTVPFPALAGLAAATRVTLDERLATMGVFASGRLAVNPKFVASLNDRDLTFVLAHEMLHLALRTHDRARGAGRLEFNLAHDYIINDMLRSALGMTDIPAGGLDMPGAKGRSAEEIVLEMRRRAREAPPPARVWTNASGEGDADGDVLADEIEREWYPGEAGDQAARAERIRTLGSKALALAEAMDALRGVRGHGGGQVSQSVAALRGLYRVPWSLALQRWLEAVAPAERTFDRPSRRGSVAPDVVLPGRRRAGWLLNVVLDTSASMTETIPQALGAIADFCDTVGVDEVRLVQCDADVTCDELVSPADLARREIRGYGGSDLSPALVHLAADAQTRAVIVITDGDIEYPREPMPYDVLWVLAAGARPAFAPPYGRVVAMH